MKEESLERSEAVVYSILSEHVRFIVKFYGFFLQSAVSEPVLRFMVF